MMSALSSAGKTSVMFPKSINNLFKFYLSMGEGSKSQVHSLCFKKTQWSKKDTDGKGNKDARVLICNVILGILFFFYEVIQFV